MTKEKVTQDNIHDILNKAISLLEKHPDEAVKLLYPYVPINGPVAIDYGIYSLQYALLFGTDIQQSAKTKQITLPNEIGDLFDKCKNEYFNEYLNLLDWISNNMKEATNKIIRARVTDTIEASLHHVLSKLQVISPETVREIALGIRMDTPKYHVLANVYKDLYEIDFFHVLLGNLVNISRGNVFSTTPFANLKMYGKDLVDKNGMLIKGLLIKWFESNTSGVLQQSIISSYNSQLRNLLGGHNAYVFDETNKIYYSADRATKYTYTELFSYLSNLERLMSALRLEGIIRHLEDSKHPAKIYDIGFMDWRINIEQQKVYVLQYWSNYWARKNIDLPKTINFYRIPFELDGKRIALAFDSKYIFPYDLRAFPSKDSIKLFKELSKLESINLIIHAVAPPVEPFTNISNTNVTIEGKDMLIIGESSTKVEIDKKSLDTLIRYLEE